MFNLTIRAKVLIIALLPVLAVTLFLTFYNFTQTRTMGEQAVASFATDMRENKKQALKNYVMLAKTAIKPLLPQAQGELTSPVIPQIWDILRHLRFDDAGEAGYFYVYKLDGTNLMHGVNPKLEGKNLWNVQDPNGLYLFQAILKAAQSGDGFVEFGWTNAATGAVAPKLGYAEILPELGVMIGTGFWIDGLDSQIAQIQGKVNQSTDQALLGAILTSAIMLAIVVALALLVARSINTPLKSAVAAMQDIASGKGDLTRRLDDHSQDELGQLGRAFNTFAEQVRSMVEQMRQSIATLNGAVKELNGVMSTAAEGVDRQRGESDQVASAMYQMTAAAQQVAGNAVQAAQAADAANEQVDNAQQLVENTVNVISGLSDQVLQGVQAIEKLGEDSTRIDSVLEVIRSIAEQTNLLALNAAIEAARAGDAGRGFAVVADEVRTLASRTQQSTVEIQQTIERLQQGARQAVQLIGAISERSEETVAGSRQVSDALQQINDAVKLITDMNNQIATAAEEQTSVSETINQNVHEIVTISEETAEGTRRADSTTRQLQQMAGEMYQQTSRYKV